MEWYEINDFNDKIGYNMIDVLMIKNGEIC